MSQHIKSLMQQLHPFLNSTKTPSPSIKTKISIKHKLTDNFLCLSAPRLKLKQNNKTDVYNHYYRKSKTTTTPKQEDKEILMNTPQTTIDSGVDTTLQQIVTPGYNSNAKKCECSKCRMRKIRRSQIEKTLKLAFSNYLKNPNEKSFANIPMLVVKTFQPDSKTLSNQLDQIEVKKASAVNALFMNDSKWIYVKTANNQIGFIPKKCCEPFVTKRCDYSTSKNIQILGEFNTPLVGTKTSSSTSSNKPTKLADHTYMTINEAELENILNNNKKKLHYNNNSMDDELNSNQTDLTLFSVSNVVQNETNNNNNKLTPEKIQHIQKFFNSSNKKSTIYLQNKSSEKIKAKYLNNTKTNNNLMIQMLKQSKSRNRKLSVAFNNTSNVSTLTMLEQQQHQQANNDRNYENLANCLECKTVKRKIKYSNISPIQEESFVCTSSDLKHHSTCKRELFVYDNLSNFKSNRQFKKAKYTNNQSSSSASSVSSNESTTTPTSMSYISTSNNYDSLVQSSSKKIKTNEYINANSMHYLNQDMESSLNNDDQDHIYNHLSSNNSKILNMLKITDDYRAEFKDDLSVQKGDLVYLIEGAASPCCEKNNDWLFVRIYKRNKRANMSNKFEMNTVQGFIPRNNTVKI